MMPPRFAVSVTSWFYHGALEMSGFEPLARSSAFCVAAARGAAAAASGLLFLSAQHVTHPHRYSHFYPDARYSFLTLLDDADVRVTLELRDAASGRILSRHAVAASTPHASRDVVLLALEDEEAFVRAARAAGGDGGGGAVAPCTLLDDDAALRSGARLRIEGFASSGDFTAAGADAEAPMLPRSVAGVFLARSGAAQSFARTESACESGMCGGPVLLVDEAEALGSGAPSGRCVGMLEGIVSPPSPPAGAGAAGGVAPDAAAASPQRRASELLANAAVFIAAAELRAFVDAAAATTARSAALR